MLDALQDSVEAAKWTNPHDGSVLACISADKFPEFLEVIPKLWAEIEERTAERGESQQSEDFDEEEFEVLQQEGQTDEEMQEMIVQCMGGFFKAFGADFLQVYLSTPLAE